MENENLLSAIPDIFKRQDTDKIEPSIIGQRAPVVLENIILYYGKLCSVYEIEESVKQWNQLSDNLHGVGFVKKLEYKHALTEYYFARKCLGAEIAFKLKYVISDDIIKECELEYGIGFWEQFVKVYVFKDYICVWW